MARAFLVTSVISLLFVLNAKRPLRNELSIGLAFFSSWLVTELALQLLVFDLVGIAVFVAYGALHGLIGWLALAFSLLSALLLAGFVRDAYRVEAVLDEALTETIGPAARRARVAWGEFAFPFKLWNRQIRRVRNVPYVEGGGRRYQLDVWQSRDEGTRRPCLLYVPGGAWVTLISNKNHQAKPLLLEMASRGWVCFTMNYPLAPRSRFPAHIIAVKRAIGWVREHAHEYGGDPHFLMISGNSAGGHLSSLAALTPNDPDYQPGFEDVDTSVQAAAVFYGVYDWTSSLIDELPRYARRHKKGMLRFLRRAVMERKAERDAFERASPLLRVSPDTPPFFIIHGDQDLLALVHEARAFAKRLRDVSRQPVVYVELPGTQHAFDHFLSIRALYAVRAMARFGEWTWMRWLNGAGPGAQSSDRANRSPTSGR